MFDIVSAEFAAKEGPLLIRVHAHIEPLVDEHLAGTVVEPRVELVDDRLETDDSKESRRKPNDPRHDQDAYP